MSKFRSRSNPAAERSQPHDPARDERQPYAKEREDYAHGVAKPPKEQAGKRADRKTGKAPAGRE